MQINTYSTNLNIKKDQQKKSIRFSWLCRSRENPGRMKTKNNKHNNKKKNIFISDDDVTYRKETDTFDILQ